MSTPTDQQAQLQLQQLRADYQKLLRRLEANQDQFNHLGRSVYRLQEDERRRLARDLHDGLGQNLTALTHQLGLLIDQLPAEQAAARTQAERALEICRSTLDDTRQMSRLLRPQVLDDFGLYTALQWLCRTVSGSSGLQCELQIDHEPELDVELATVVFRVVQEALTNVVRHAGAQRADVRLGLRGQWLQIEVQDDGSGLPDPSAATLGSGLGGMRERLRLFNGELSLQPGDPKGLRVRALLPLMLGTSAGET